MSYPLNFGIYCGMSKQFRDTFKQLIPVVLTDACSRNNNNRNNGDIRGTSRPSGNGGHRRPKTCNNSNLVKQVIVLIDWFQWGNRKLDIY